MSNAVVVSNPNILGGIPVFAGTLVPVCAIFENLADGASIEEILEAYPSVKREQVIEVLREADSVIERSVSPRGTAEAGEDKFFEQMRLKVREGVDEANRGELVDEADVWDHLSDCGRQLRRERGAEPS